jgi:hypothetical protein
MTDQLKNKTMRERIANGEMPILPLLSVTMKNSKGEELPIDLRPLMGCGIEEVQLNSEHVGVLIIHDLYGPANYLPMDANQLDGLALGLTNCAKTIRNLNATKLQAVPSA